MSPKLRKTLKQMTENKRKFSMMLFLMSVALLLWGRLMLKQVPRTAVADPEAEAAKLAQIEGMSAFDALVATSHATVYLDLPYELSRDVFFLDTRHYQTLDGADDLGEGKSRPEAADDGLQARLAAKAESALELQSTVHGEQIGAVINGRLLIIGQEIEGFVLREVRSRHVVLESSGIEVRLNM